MKEIEEEIEKKRQEQVKALEMEIEAEKKLLAKEFALWESNLMMPSPKPVEVCENRRQQAALTRMINIVPWVTVSQAVVPVGYNLSTDVTTIHFAEPQHHCVITHNDIRFNLAKELHRTAGCRQFN